jgi:hypothetical protein
MMRFVLEPMRGQAPFSLNLLHCIRDKGVDEFRKWWRWDPEDDVSVMQFGIHLFGGICDIVRINMNSVKRDLECVMKVTLR